MSNIHARADALILSARSTAHGWGFAAIGSMFVRRVPGQYERLERVAAETAAASAEPGCRALASAIAGAAAAALLARDARNISHAEATLRRAAVELAAAKRLLA